MRWLSVAVILKDLPPPTCRIPSLSDTSTLRLHMLIYGIPALYIAVTREEHLNTTLYIMINRGNEYVGYPVNALETLSHSTVAYLC
ncbi:hypothetical protein HS088_TW17G00225 [Tripterygium wilfordii]|uniref:Uncharacterized protein n=1 Tax=Tripterygium wilfordii TaxID=458696 RepID=A0A7J7CFI2_TRIWF|nr:hypothetical protein HS088_TW17G00225 [Tripterygium wilfordii]